MALLFKNGGELRRHFYDILTTEKVFFAGENDEKAGI